MYFLAPLFAPATLPCAGHARMPIGGRTAAEPAVPRDTGWILKVGAFLMSEMRRSHSIAARRGRSMVPQSRCPSPTDSYSLDLGDRELWRALLCPKGELALVQMIDQYADHALIHLRDRASLKSDLNRTC